MINWKKLRTHIPTKVQVGKNKYYEVLWVEPSKDNPNVGITDFQKKQIVLNLGQSPKQTVSTYVHELLHAFSAESEADLTEPQVLALEETLYYWLKPENIFKK